MKQTLAICFTNFGPYHLARLEALGQSLQAAGGQLIAYELAGSEEKYPWSTASPTSATSFQWIRLFPGQSVESLRASQCRRAMLSRLDFDQPTAIAAVGYARPESMAMLKWARTNGALRILLSESQKIDLPRVWWKEAIKRTRVRQFQAGLVGGESHRSYLVDLGLPADSIHLGYNAVGNQAIESIATLARQQPAPLAHPYFLTVCRFAPEKNLSTLLNAYSAYVASLDSSTPPWHLVLAGDGPLRDTLRQQAQSLGVAHLCHWPGFLGMNQLAPYYSHAGAFVLPSLSEPWGLVVNEAAVCGVPLIVSSRCGSADTFVPASGMPSGRQFDPTSTAQLADTMKTISALSPAARQLMGTSAASIASQWGPDRFATGMMKALESARSAQYSEVLAV